MTDIICGTEGYNFLIKIEKGKPVFKKILWEHQRQKKNINEIPIPSKGYTDRIKEWKRRCSHPYCARGLQRLSFNGHEFEDLINNESLIVKKLIEVTSKFDDPILIEGGHFIPELSDFNFVPEQPLSSFKKTLEIIYTLTSQHNKTVDLMIFINDLHMGKGEFLSRVNRQDYLDDFTLPLPMKELLINYQKKCSFNVFVTTEKKMALKLNREKGNLLRNGKIKKINKQYFLSSPIKKYKNLEIINNSSHNPLSGFIKCLAACSRVIKLTSEMGYKNYIQIFPVCAFEGTELAYNISKYLFDINMNIVNFYTTVTCFSNAKNISYKQSKPLDFI